MKKLVSFGLSILLMIVGVVFGMRILLSEVLLNEEFYRELQQDVKLAETILEQVTTDLQTLMRTNNLPEELVIDLVPLSDIEAAIQLQTTETIELLKGNNDTMTILNPEPYVWELEPRIMNYLNEEGYKVEESGYDDLAQINKSVYELTRGDIHLFDISKLMYSGTVDAISMVIQFIMGSLPFIFSVILFIGYFLIWKFDVRQIIYWLSSSILAAGVFGIMMLSRVSDQTIGISTNSAFNQGISTVILQCVNRGQVMSYYLFGLSFVVILLLYLLKVLKFMKKY